MECFPAHVFDTASGTVCVTDPSGTVLYINSAIFARTGYEAAQVIGRKAGALWGKKMDASYYARMWNTISKKRSPFISDISSSSKSGESLQDRVHIAPVLNDSAEVAYFLEVHPTKVKETFSDEFYNSMSTQSVDFALLSRWIGASGDSVPPVLSFDRTLTEYLVQPSHVRFTARTEDARLILAAKQDKRLFAALYTAYVHDVNMYIHGRLGDTLAAEDLVQDVFTRAFVHLDAFTVSNASYKTYLLRVAHNALVNYYRKTAPIHLYDGVEDMVAEKMDRRGDALDLAAALPSLSSVEQNIVRMKYTEGASVRDIAVTLSKTENAVKLHLSRARKKLKDTMELS